METLNNDYGYIIKFFVNKNVQKAHGFYICSELKY